MRAAMVEAPQAIAVRDVPEPSPSNGRVTVRVTRAGICGTDLKILDGSIPTSLPRVLGHELIGTVADPGSAGWIARGQRVLVDPSVGCGHCALCRSDRVHLCRDGALLGRDTDGGFAQRVAVDEGQLHPLPASVGDREAPLLQVLGTCVHAQTLVDVFPGQVAVVIGLGVSGLLHTQLLRARGLTDVVGVSRSTSKLRLAEDLGATATASPDEAPALVNDITGGRGADLVVESAGTVSGLGQAVDLAGVGGKLLAFGTITERSGVFPFYDLYFKELDIRNSRAARARDYARAMQLVAGGTVRLTPLITSSFPLDEIDAALAACRDARGQLKIMLDIA